MGDVELPSLPTSIEHMTRDSLRSFIPQMIRFIENGETPQFGNKSKKPQWWPVNAPWSPLRLDVRDTDSKTRISWTEELRNVVRCCYRYYNSEHMLHEGTSNSDEPIPLLPQKLDITAHSNVTSPTHFTDKMPASLEAKNPVAPRSQMYKENMSPLPEYFMPSGDVPEQASMYTTKGQVQVRTSARLERKRDDDVHEIFWCTYCNSEFRTFAILKRHQNVCYKCPHNKGSLFEISECPPTEYVTQIHVDLLPRARKVDLTERLGLLPLSKAKVVRKQRSRVREIQITKLDDTDQDPARQSPTTPRGKSLMAQLSRDFTTPVKSRRKSLFHALIEEGGKIKPQDVSDAESVNSKASDRGGDNDQPLDPWNKDKRNNILTIDFSSALGTRVVTLMSQQAEKMLQYAEETTTNYEEYCHTPKKSDLIRRLRDRKDLITFKKNRRICPKWAHSYKFTYAERLEWYRTIRTGLNSRSRPLRKLLKKCSVRIKRATKEEIKEWTARKPRDYLMTPYQTEIMLRQNPGLTFIPRSPGGPSELSRMLGLRVHGSPNGIGYKSVFNEMQSGGSRFGSSHNTAIRGVSPWKSLTKSPGQLRAMSNSHPVTKGVYSNSNNQDGYSQLSNRNYNVPHAVSQSVVRNLQQQMNYDGDPNSGRNIANQTTDVNDDKPAENRCVQKVRSSHNTPIVIDDDEDDIYLVSSSEGDTAPPNKKRKVETETSLIFKCHLCGEELQCRVTFAACIEKHFADKHDVRTIQLIEHIDRKGQKVVSIVDTRAEPETRKHKAPNKKSHKSMHKKSNKSPMASHNSRNNTAKQGPKPNRRSASLSPKAKIKHGSKNPSTTTPKNRSTSRPPKSGDSGKRKLNRSQNDSSPVPVICID